MDGAILLLSLEDPASGTLVSHAVQPDLPGSSRPDLDSPGLRGRLRLRWALLSTGALLGGDAADGPVDLFCDLDGLCDREPGKDVGRDLPGDRRGNGYDFPGPGASGPLLVEALPPQEGAGSQEDASDRGQRLGVSCPFGALPGSLYGNPGGGGGRAIPTNTGDVQEGCRVRDAVRPEGPERSSSGTPSGP